MCHTSYYRHLMLAHFQQFTRLMSCEKLVLLKFGVGDETRFALCSHLLISVLEISLVIYCKMFSIHSSLVSSLSQLGSLRIQSLSQEHWERSGYIHSMYGNIHNPLQATMHTFTYSFTPTSSHQSIYWHILETWKEPRMHPNIPNTLLYSRRKAVLQRSRVSELSVFIKQQARNTRKTYCFRILNRTQQAPSQHVLSNASPAKNPLDSETPRRQETEVRIEPRTLELRGGYTNHCVSTYDVIISISGCFEINVKCIRKKK